MLSKNGNQTRIFKKVVAITICLSMSLSLVVNQYHFANADEISTDESTLEENPSYVITEEETSLATDESTDNLDEISTEVPETSEDNSEEIITEVPETSEAMAEEVVLETPEVTEALTKELLSPRIQTTDGILKPNNKDDFLTDMASLEDWTSNPTVTVDMSNLSDSIELTKEIKVNSSIESLTFENANNITLTAKGFRHFQFPGRTTSTSLDFDGMILTGDTSSAPSGGIEMVLGATAPNVSIKNVTIENCSNEKGNAIQITTVSTANPTITIGETAGETADVILSNNTNEISGSQGGAIYLSGARATLTSYATISGNQAGEGGGIYASTDDPEKKKFISVKNQGEISENIAKIDGGGVYCDDYIKPSTLDTLDTSTIKVTGNEAKTGNGGGIYLSNFNPIQKPYIHGEVSGNTADKNGGGIYAPSSYIVTIGTAVVKGNTATTGNGGGIFAAGTLRSEVETSSSVIENTAGNDGGGIYMSWKKELSGVLTLSDGEVSGNTAGNDGGGIYALDANSLNIHKSEVSGNTAENSGGGIYAPNVSTMILNYTTVSGNTAEKGDGGGIYCKGILNSLRPTIEGNSALKGKGGGIFSVLPAGSTPHGTSFNLNGGSISNNIALQGGGIYSDDVPQFNSSVSGDPIFIRMNKAKEGGGLYLNIGINSSTALTLSCASVEGNVAQLGGGAYIYGKDGSDAEGYKGVTVQLSPYSAYPATAGYKGISSNIANSGGGIYASGKVFIFLDDNSVISGNQAVLDLKQVVPDLNDYGISNISNTSLAGYGGGIYVDEKFVFDATKNNKLSSILSYSDPSYGLTGSKPIISGNKAAKSGGGIAVGNNAYLTLIDGTMENNEAGIGGAIGLIPSAGSINLNKFDGNKNYSNSKFIFKGNKGTNQINLDHYVTKAADSEKILTPLSGKYSVKSLNHFSKYSDKYDALKSDNFYTVTENGSVKSFDTIFDNNDVQYSKGIIDPKWEADNEKWYSEETLGMTYTDIIYSVAMFDKVVDGTATIDTAEIDTKVDNSGYKFKTSGVYEGYVYGTVTSDDSDKYGVIRILKPYNIDIDKPAIANEVITPTKNSITVTADFTDEHSGVSSVQIEVFDNKNKLVKTVTSNTPSVSETFSGLKPRTNYSIKYTVIDKAVDKTKEASGNVLTLTSNTKTLGTPPVIDGGEITDENDKDKDVTEKPVVPVVPEKPVVTNVPPAVSPVPTNTPSTDDIIDDGSLIIPDDRDNNSNTSDTVNIINPDGAVIPVRIEKSPSDENIYIILDENGVPLGFVELEPGEDLSSIDIFSRLQPLTDEMKGNIKVNPKTGNNANTNNYKYFIPVILAVGIYFTKKRKYTSSK